MEGGAEIKGVAKSFQSMQTNIVKMCRPAGPCVPRQRLDLRVAGKKATAAFLALSKTTLESRYARAKGRPALPSGVVCTRHKPHAWRGSECVDCFAPGERTQPATRARGGPTAPACTGLEKIVRRRPAGRSPRKGRENTATLPREHGDPTTIKWALTHGDFT